MPLSSPSDNSIDNSMASISKVMMLGQITFLATLTGFIADDSFFWTLKFQQQSPPSFAYQCTVNQKLFAQVSERYNFSSPQKFFELIKESLFEGKGLKSLGYYFGEEKKRTPEDGSLPLVLEITIELYTVMKFTLVLDSLQGGVGHHTSNDVNNRKESIAATVEEIRKVLQKLIQQRNQDLERIRSLEKNIDFISRTVGIIQSDLHSVRMSLNQGKAMQWQNIVDGTIKGISDTKISEEFHKHQAPQVESYTASESSPLQKLPALFTAWSSEKIHNNLELLNNNRTIRCIEGLELVSCLGNAIFDEGVHEWSIRVDNLSPDGRILIGIADPGHELDTRCGFASHSYAFSIVEKVAIHMGIPKPILCSQDKVNVVGIILNLSTKKLSIQINDDEPIEIYDRVSPPLTPCVTLCGQNSQITLQFSGRKF